MTTNNLAIRKHFKIWAKIGYIARGVIYLAIGFLALKTTFSLGGKMTDTKGALTALRDSPLGDALLWAMVVGLIGYVIWRFNRY